MINRKRFLYLLLPAFLIVFVNIAAASDAWIRDEQGRALILHGLNISNQAKYAPGHISWHEFGDFERMQKEWGFNVIRFLIFWDGVEPEPWTYDDAYLDKVAERIDWARQLGIYVILDMHQDLYGPKFSGDGAPLWATWDDSLSFELQEPWWFNYLQPAVRRAFTNFFSEQELMDHYIAMWTHVAERFRSYETVLGFDLMNEPFFGEFGPVVFEFYYLKKFYLDLIESMKSAAPEKLFFYEPQTITASGLPSFLGILDEENLVYFPHYYQPLVHEGYPYFGNKFLLDLAMSMRDSEASSAHIPWLLGEFGVAATTKGMDYYLMDLLSLLNEKIAGWTYWSYDKGSENSFCIIDFQGQENAQMNYLVQPYAQKISGDPVRMKYNSDKKIFAFEFKENGYSSSPTEIYTAARRIYPQGFRLYCSDPKGSWTWDYDETVEIIKIWTDPMQGSHKIAIVPAS